MKILQISPRPPDFPAGVEIFVKKLTKSLKEKELVCDILTGDPKYPSESVRTISGIKCIFQKFIFAFGGVNFEIFNTFKTLIKIGKNYDILHIHSFVTISGLQALLYAKIFRKPAIMTIHGNLKNPIIKNQSILQTLKMYLIRIYYNLLGKMIVGFADAVISVSKIDLMNINKELFCSRKKNNYWIPNCISLKSKLPNFTRKYITYIGRLSSRKGFDDFIKIMDVVNTKYPKIPILIIGEGPLQFLIDQYKTKLNIHYIKKVSNEKIQDFYCKTKLFVMNSWVEGLPTVILEAMAYEAVVVSTNIGGIPELIIDKENGRLFSPGEIILPAEIICYLLENEIIQKKYVQNSIKLIKRKFTCRSIAENHLKIYSKIMREMST
ncbi:glycosyltransferase family 4 protein [Promethearchaeum syntrophicum]|uniref:Glycosyltransferase family 4 protein n=1 Tax=Promethearchaeum syntrophicum TaxID=2594042 RepID=A0A5B9DAN2_9ARCH|nr:glycosyltransferase family 4 protein [Candidatus Prometheoarchaeum syntrophicum]QEE16071.1 Trehalose synthase [Candidatus Prometheoarchaeum syntrophicum]